MLGFRVSAISAAATLLARGARAHCSAVVRKPAPAFTATAVVNEKFETVKLADYAGNWLVLFFYPLDFTFVCPTEITAFSDRISEFEAIGTKVAAVSVDSQFSHLAWVQTPRNKGGLGKMNIPILADIRKEISREYGVLIEDAADPDAGVALRGTFVIDPKGVLRSAQVNDLPVGRSVDEVLRIVQAFQYVEKHGEVCPAGWRPGAKTMVADPVKSQTYFSQLK